jgi:hypothetical protein
MSKKHHFKTEAGRYGAVEPYEKPPGRDEKPSEFSHRHLQGFPHHGSLLRPGVRVGMVVPD